MDARNYIFATDKSYVKRFLKQTKYADALTDYNDKMLKARSDLLLVAGALGYGNSETILHEVRALQQQSSPQAAAIDENGYTEAIKAEFGKLLQQADAIEGEGYAFRRIELNDVFIPQDARLCDEIDFSVLDIPADFIAQLKHESELLLHVDVEQRIRKRATFEDKKRQPVMGILNNRSIRLVVILGDAGAGKTTLLHEYAIKWALKSSTERTEFPIVIELRKYAAEKKLKEHLTLLDLIAEGGTLQWPLDKANLLSRLQSSEHSVLLMLDGLDEIFDFEVRTMIINEIGTFVNVHNHSSTRVVVTSRVIGYKMSELFKFDHYMLQPFSPAQINNFINTWHHLTYTDQEKPLREERKSH